MGAANGNLCVGHPGAGASPVSEYARPNGQHGGPQYYDDTPAEPAARCVIAGCGHVMTVAFALQRRVGGICVSHGSAWLASPEYRRFESGTGRFTALDDFVRRIEAEERNAKQGHGGPQE